MLVDSEKESEMRGISASSAGKGLENVVGGRLGCAVEARRNGCTQA